MDDRLIVGLDLPDAAAARALVAGLRDEDRVLQDRPWPGSLPAASSSPATCGRARGKRVFLDMKLFDIGATVTAATRGLVERIAPDFLTVHGDPQVVAAAVAGRGDAVTRLLAVTILTSLDRADLDAALIREGQLSDIVLERARRAFAAGADGVIASPREAARLRALPDARGKLIVTPGIRPAGGKAGDQKRIATPAEALAAGADHLVVGRPIWAAPDPRAAARAILAEMTPVASRRLMPDARPLAISAPFPRTLDLIFTGASPRPPARALRNPPSRPRPHRRSRPRRVSPARVTSSASRRSPARRWRRCPRSAASSTSSRTSSTTCPTSSCSSAASTPSPPAPSSPSRWPNSASGSALDLARGITEADLRLPRGPRALGRRRQPRRPPACRATRSASSASATSAARWHRLLAGFRFRIRAFDPWLPPSVLSRARRRARAP